MNEQWGPEFEWVSLLWTQPANKILDSIEIEIFEREDLNLIIRLNLLKTIRKR